MYTRLFLLRNLFSVRLQDLLSRREKQEESPSEAADAEAYTGKPTFALQ